MFPKFNQLAQERISLIKYGQLTVSSKLGLGTKLSCACVFRVQNNENKIKDNFIKFDFDF